MKTKYILLIVGFLGVMTSVLGLIKGQEITTYLISFICGVSLIQAYLELNKNENENSKTN